MTPVQRTTDEQGATRYDYVVVGAGAAGGVVASRLSEDASADVLLLEAGGPDSLEAISIPPAWPSLLGTEVDWSYTTTPQPHAAGRSQPVPRGKVLGGSSSINVMGHIRGHRADYDAWAYAGNPGWGFRDVLPYFKRMEHCPDRDPEYRGVGGPLRPAPASEPNPTSEAFLEAAAEVGHRPTDDFNAAQPEGFGWLELLITDGRRRSVAATYIRSAAERSNLTVRTRARARRLTFDGSRCTGVEYEHDGTLRRAVAGAEVVLCAGAIESPKLLMLSGAGPADELRDLGLPVVADLPGVGQNLIDHLMLGVVYEARRPIPEGKANYGESLVVWRSDPGRIVPDFQFLFIHIPLPPSSAPMNSFTVAANLMRPVSRGSIRLAGADPEQPPLIDPGYLSEGADVEALLTGVGHARELAAAPAFDAWRAREAEPGAHIRDESGLRAFVAENAVSYFHPVGTCRMGIDHMAVVDPELRVRGLEGLRVADASIMPSIVTANTNAASMMIGEKAADLIRGARPAGRDARDERVTEAA